MTEMSGMHSKVDFYACGSFGTVTNLRTYENPVCTSHTETTNINLQLIGSDNYGLNFKRIYLPSSSLTSACKCASIVVDFIQPNSPASNSGRIQVGDRLLNINGHSTTNLTIDEICEIMETTSDGLDLQVEFDVYETCSVLNEIIAIRLLKYSNHAGIQLQPGQSGNGRKEDLILVKSIMPASVAFRCGAIEVGDELLAIDDIPMSGCSVEEAARLLHTSQNSLKIHLKKRYMERKVLIDEEGSVFNYTVELKPNKEPLGLMISEEMRVVGLQKDGFCWRTGSICIGDQIGSIDGKSIAQPYLEVQKFLNENVEGTLFLGMSRRLQYASKLESNGLSTLSTGLSNGSRHNSINDVYRATTPSYNRLNLINIQKVIGVMATSIQNKELQALRAFEKVEDQLLVGRPSLQRNSITTDELVPKRIGQRLSSDSFSSSGFGSNMSQQSAPETPSCSCSHSTSNPFAPILYSPISLFDPHTKNVLLLRDSDQAGFGFSISESEERGIFVNAVKHGGMAQQNGISPNDRILQVNNVTTTNMNCSQLLPLFDTDILELILYNDDEVNANFKL